MKLISNKIEIVNTDNTFIHCNGSEWQTINLPRNKKIRSITGTATETIILTESDEFYYFGENLKSGQYFTECNKKLYHFNFSDFVNNFLKLDYIPKIKEIFSVYGITILQLENDQYILFTVENGNVHGLYIKDNLKMFASCPLSFRFIAINKNNKFKYWEQFNPTKSTNAIKEKTVSNKVNDILDKLVQKGIKILSCGSNFSVIVTNENKMYVEGPNTFSSNGITTAEFEYTYLKTPFEEVSEIKQVKCGYFHTVVLLNNGKVFAVGYNLLKQCGQNSAEDSHTFMEFKLPIGLQVKEIGCSSRGTYFTTINTDKVYFVGECTDRLQQEEFGDVSAHCLNLQYSANLKFNTVVPSGWHYAVYYKNLKESKSLIYFKNNLKTLTTSNYFKDMYFKFNK